jgi:hypothetical protein
VHALDPVHEARVATRFPSIWFQQVGRDDEDVARRDIVNRTLHVYGNAAGQPKRSCLLADNFYLEGLLGSGNAHHRNPVITS